MNRRQHEGHCYTHMRGWASAEITGGQHECAIHEVCNSLVYMLRFRHVIARGDPVLLVDKIPGRIEYDLGEIESGKESKFTFQIRKRIKFDNDYQEGIDGLRLA